MTSTDCEPRLERWYSEDGDKEHKKGDDHEDRHRSQHGASAVRRGNTHVQGTCMPRLILRLLRPMWSTSGTGPPTCADVEGAPPRVVAPVAAEGWGRSLRGKVTHAGDPCLPCHFLTHPANNQRTPVTPGSCRGHRVTPWIRRGRRTDDEPTCSNDNRGAGGRTHGGGWRRGNTGHLGWAVCST